MDRISKLLCVVALACLAWPGLARAQAGGSFRDRVIDSAAASAKTAPAASAGVSYPVAGGQSVHVVVDPVYNGTDALQRILDTLGATVHGAEMNNLTVRIADQSTLYSLCGPSSTACYFASTQTMVVSGDPVNPNNQMPQAMVITHEYGHHIEANRSFGGWNASDLGGRHWATYEHVCEGVATGQLFPGNEGSHYWENPGEAFAQAYATMLFPDAVPWWWSFAQPDQGAFDAIRADVADTSQGTAATWTQTLNRRTRSASTNVTGAMDGPINVTVRQPRGARFNVSLLSGGQVVSTARVNRSAPRGKHKKGKRAKAASVSQLSYPVCGGSRSYQLQVSRLAGKGKFTAQIIRP